MKGIHYTAALAACAMAALAGYDIAVGNWINLFFAVGACAANIYSANRTWRASTGET